MSSERKSYPREHLDLNTLKERQGNKDHGYLLNYVPAYPRPELHVSHVSHSTDLQGLQGISPKGQFKALSNNHQRPKQLKVVWFSLTVSPEELRDAESRSVTVVHPDGEEEGDLEQDTLQKFAKSPAFRSSSRYGSFRFTFSLEDVLNKYRKQVCRGKKPVLRVYGTVLYQKEVMYAVLVHSPINNRRFSGRYPLLEESSICEFESEPEPHFVWRPESMSDSYRFKLKNINGKYSTEEALRVYKDGSEKPHYYLWDHVALALHVGNKKLKFKKQELRDGLRFCEEDYPSVKPHTPFQTFEKAEAEVKKLWPHHHLQKFNQSPFHVTE